MEFEIWDSEAFQSIAVFETEVAALDWVRSQLTDPAMELQVGRLSLIASSDSADNVVASGRALIDAARRTGSIARTA